MTKVKLLSDITGQGDQPLKEGSVVDLDAAVADHFISIGVAEPSDGAVDAAPTTKPQQEVEPAASPLSEATAGLTGQPAAAQDSQPGTPEAPASLSTDLHLG